MFLILNIQWKLELIFTLRLDIISDWFWLVHEKVELFKYQNRIIS